MTFKERKKSTIKGLVMARKEGDIISISNGELKIEIVEIRGGIVRLAFNAAKDILITHQKALARSQVNNNDKLSE